VLAFDACLWPVLTYHPFMNSGSCLLAALLLAAPALGQVRLELGIDQEQYLPGEPIAVAVRITNLSGQPLHLGEQPDWLTFFVERKENNFILPKSAEAPVAGGFTVESSLAATRYINIAPYFNLSQPGRYHLTANVKIPQWEKEVNAKPRNFDIIAGARIWEQEFGVPQANSASPPIMRRYALVQASYFKNIKLYIRVSDDTDTQVLHVFALGPMVSFSRPEAQVDKASQLHVLYQAGARAFHYSVVDPEGREIIKDIYDYTQNRPILRGDGEGKVFVTGGRRRTRTTETNSPPVALTPQGQ